MLNDTNFLEWKEALIFQLGLMDLDICFRLYALVALIDESNMDVRILHERWERSNRLSYHSCYNMCLELLDVIRCLVQKFTSMHYTGKRNIWEYITAMHDIVGKLNDLKITILETFLVHYILQTLPTKYDLSKVSITHIMMNGQ
ncbi:unnamed protein product [Spirodela intermedia]|uniref:Uncharacterized protein n=1 Tax=Spirodela intermedia TaxID=51605 RepID=A0ABN7EA85_SPIIN|nr:unnamed protein product [Spirodela intermedia]